MDKKQLDQIAAHYESRENDDSHDDELTPVKSRVAKPIGLVYSTRYSADEISLIREAAKKQGLAPSTFIRASALAAASGELNLDAAKRVEALQEAKTKARELAQALEDV